ncbi:hypothetical protein MRX96_021510 [Rhipicephalus microplus]
MSVSTLPVIVAIAALTLRSTGTTAAPTATMTAPSAASISPPTPLNFDRTSELREWIMSFDDYRYALGLIERTEEACRCERFCTSWAGRPGKFCRLSSLPKKSLTVVFLGYVVDASGIRPDPKKVGAINEMPTPSSVDDVGRFLGMINYLARFVSDLADVLAPLRSLLVKDLLHERRSGFINPLRDTQTLPLSRQRGMGVINDPRYGAGVHTIGLDK